MKSILLMAATLAVCFSLKAQPVRIMLVTGGHSFDTLQFFQMFESFNGVKYESFNQPEANKSILNGTADDFDVLVFYDMWKEISEPQKKAYLDLTKKGKPFLFLHHALVSYQGWPEFEKLVGGRYVQNPGLDKSQQSTYKHDVWIDVDVSDNVHPVTRGMNSFRLFDEVYGNYRVSTDVLPLLRTTHAESTPVIGWENRYNESHVIYLQPGHDSHAFKSEEYRKLLRQAIFYLSGNK